MSSHAESKHSAFTRHMAVSSGSFFTASGIMPSVLPLTQLFISRRVPSSNCLAKMSDPAKEAQSARNSPSGSNVPSSRNQMEFAAFAAVPSRLDIYAASDARSVSASAPRAASICARVSPRAPASAITSTASTLTGEMSVSVPS